MLELLQAGGWLMWPILACSVVAVAIIIERLWMLRSGRVIPKHLLAEVWQLQRTDKLQMNDINDLRKSSPLGRILASGLMNRHHSREIMKEAVEDTGRQVVHQLERYLNTLGTIAAITPLLGLLGTVIGMIKVFTTITAEGVGDPTILAGGISEALITTAAGMSVAIPSLMFFRFFQGRINALVVRMEEESMQLVEVMAGERTRAVEDDNG